MEVLYTKYLTEAQNEQINLLWNEAYPIKLKNRFPLLLVDATDHDHYLIEDKGLVIAWAVAFEKEGEVRFSIIVRTEYSGNGLGALLLKHIKKDRGVFYGWVIDHSNDDLSSGEKYQTPLPFYEKQGFEVLPSERIDSEMINAVKIRSKVDVFAETERLILREILPTDVEGMFELDSDPEVHRYLGNNPVNSKEQIAEVIRFVRQQYLNNGIGRWAIIDKYTEDFWGWAGLKLVTDPVNNQVNYIDLGYRIIRKYWGRGIATEAATASLKYAFETMKVPQVIAIADVDNIGSNKIIKKLGFVFEESFNYDGAIHNWYRLKNPNIFS